MTLNELIEQAQKFRAEGMPGDTQVFVMTPTGTMPIAALGDSIGFADQAGTQPVPVVVVLPEP